MTEIKYRIYSHIGSISQPNNGWTKELNIVSWNNREPVYDLRTWNENHSKFGKGITITLGQMKILKALLDNLSDACCGWHISDGEPVQDES